MSFRQALLLLVTLAPAPALARATFANLEFYASNNCRGTPAFKISTNSKLETSCHWSQSKCRNDVARSMKVRWTDATVWISVYDHPQGRGSDDVAAFIFKRRVAGRNYSTCIRTFEARADTDAYLHMYERHNGLDGKVSYITVSVDHR